MHGHVCDSRIGAENPACGSSEIARLAYMVLNSAKRQAQSRRSSETLCRREFRTLLCQYQELKQDPNRSRERIEMKRRLIELHHAIRSFMVIPKQQSTRSKKPHPEAAAAAGTW